MPGRWIYGVWIETRRARWIRPAVFSRYVVVNPEVTVKVEDRPAAQVMVYQIFPGLDNVLFADQEWLAKGLASRIWVT